MPAPLRRPELAAPHWPAGKPQASKAAGCGDSCPCAPCQRHAASSWKRGAAGALPPRAPAPPPPVNNRQAMLSASMAGRAAGDLFDDPYGGGGSGGGGGAPTLEAMLARIPSAHLPREWSTYSRERQTAWAREYLRAAEQRAALNAALAEIPGDELPPREVWSRMSEADRRAWVQNFARERGLSATQTNDLIRRALQEAFESFRSIMQREYDVEIAQINARARIEIARLTGNAQGESTVLDDVRNSGNGGANNGNGTMGGNGGTNNNNGGGDSMGGGLGWLALGMLALRLFGGM